MKFISSAVKIAVLVIASLSASLAKAEMSDLISGHEIIGQLSAFLSEKQIESAPALDKDRQFRACSKPLAFTPLFGGFKTIEVRCPDADGWKIAVRSQIKTVEKTKQKQVIKQPQKPVLAPLPAIEKQIVVMRRSVTKGAIISLEDVKIDQIRPGTSGDYFSAIDDVVGRVAKRRLNIGKPVTSSQLEHDWLIREGQAVNLSAEIGAVSVQSKGIALEDAQMGQMARFLNVSSNKEVFGRVKSDKKIIIRANIY